jgi:hypothetical protein
MHTPDDGGNGEREPGSVARRDGWNVGCSGRTTLPKSRLSEESMELRTGRRFGLAASGPLLAVALFAFATTASAQIVYDGNILWNNGNGTLAGQFTGTANPDSVPACPTKTALIVGTVDYTNNDLTDPFLFGSLDIVHPNWQPPAGSPAYAGNPGHGKTVNVPVDGFFTQVCYTGALGPNPADDWTQGWTYYDSSGAGRQDLHLTGMPNPRPLAILSGNLYQNRTLAADSNYVLRGTTRVKDQATLTIPAGVVIFGERSTQGVLIIERGAKINAVGTATNPIIFTSDDAPGLQARGGWGGVWLLGRAVCNCANTAGGDSCISEGGFIGQFGGTNDDDNSGTLRYVRVEYSGFPIAPDNELNSFTFDGVGRNTTIDHIQAHRGADDGVEFFGGVAQVKYVVSTDGGDDGYDWQMGFRGKAQFVVVRCLADKVGYTPGVAPDKGIEADNNEFGFDTLNGPRSSPTISNFTFVGDRRSGGTLTGCTFGAHFRRGTSGGILNSIVYNWKSQAFRMENDATFRQACSPVQPGIYCSSGSVAVGDNTAGTVFVARSFPNPFSHANAIRFSLPNAAFVTVSLYTPGGRLVRTIIEGRMSAGDHVVNWQADGGMPAGMYLYRVVADSRSAQGKVLRVD